MASPIRARLQLFTLWLAGALQCGVLVLIAHHTVMNLQADRYSALYTVPISSWLVFASLPALLLTPLNAVLAGSNRAWTTMITANFVTIGVLCVASFVPDASSLSVFGVVALASSFFFAAGARLFFAALADSRWRSTVVVATGAFGLMLVIRLAFSLGFEIREVTIQRISHFPRDVLIPAVLALGSSIFCRYHPRDSIPLREGIAKPFVAGIRDVVRHRLARNSLIGLFLWFFVTATVLIVSIRIEASLAGARTENPVVTATIRFTLGMLVGIAIASLNRHSFRCGWVIPFAAGLALSRIFVLQSEPSSEWPLAVLGGALGAMLPPMLHYYFTWTTPKYHGVAVSVLIGAWCLAALALAILVSGIDPEHPTERLHPVLLTTAGVGFLAAFFGFFRPAIEGVLEIVFAPIYRIRAYGPGVRNLPPRGPYLVIGNHSAWLDPLFLAKILPPPTVPMMTSKFYDLPVISFLMRRVIGTIRVPETPYRHEAPELLQAVKSLNDGDCVVLFPEGYLRRKEEQPLRRFGRGVWKILADRPQTPVFACWIEGNWGSYCSYRGGLPTKNKLPDFWRRIRVGVIGPITVDPTLLSDHMAVRLFLMRQVSAARVPLGLEELPLPNAPVEEEKE